MSAHHLSPNNSDFGVLLFLVSTVDVGHALSEVEASLLARLYALDGQEGSIIILVVLASVGKRGLVVSFEGHERGGEIEKG